MKRPELTADEVLVVTLRNGQHRILSMFNVADGTCGCCSERIYFDDDSRPSKEDRPEDVVSARLYRYSFNISQFCRVQAG